MTESTRPVLLVIRDGWGENHNAAHDAYNAVKQSHTPCCDLLSQNWPHTEIMACGLDVGLPEGVVGNSEVGHQNIGAGRIVDQEIVRIDKAFSEKRVRDLPVMKEIIARCTKDGRLHLMGLLSDAGVHSLNSHLYHLLDIAKEAGLKEVFVHAFMDGRDTPPMSGLGFIEQLEEKLSELGIGKIATVCGRFWSMDRDNRWDRVQKAYDCLTGRSVEVRAQSAAQAVKEYYENPLDSSRCGDEFVLPTIITNKEGDPFGCIEGGDSVLFFNFRGDRPREITRAFIDDDFSGFNRGKKLNLFYATMTEYEKGLCGHVLFLKPPKMEEILGKVVSERGLKQFRCAETEKYPHVTFFFNDYRDKPFPGEDWKLVPSPKEVATYDLKPEMSSVGVTEATRSAILSGKYALIVVNYANSDMVGHTGSLSAAIKACEAVDLSVCILLEALDQMNGRAVITADHGNSDQMWEPEIESPHTRHTLNPVEVIVYGDGCQKLKLRPEGRLADIAPTLLQLMEIEKPSSMTGESLILN